jgi:hypothetical protein
MFFFYSILSLWFWMNGGYQWFIVVIGGSTLIEDLSLEKKIVLRLLDEKDFCTWSPKTK